ncbi:MAG: universal stress protein [Anaerolineae bacterium]|nr:universal stress protein [Anaerolineae bacterium]
MSGILAAIRGGPASKSTIVRAIELAQTTGLPLYFLYVVNLDFLAHTSSTRVQTISHEMHQMGEFILLSAQAEASSRGIVAHGIVRHGDVGEEIVKLSNEIEADYLILGRPRLQQEESLFTRDLLHQLITQTEEQTGAQIILSADETS